MVGIPQKHVSDGRLCFARYGLSTPLGWETITVQEPLDQGLKLSMVGTFSQSLPTIDPPLGWVFRIHGYVSSLLSQLICPFVSFDVNIAGYLDPFENAGAEEEDLQNLFPQVDTDHRTTCVVTHPNAVHCRALLCNPS